jgi:hypothetical protein
MNFWDDVGKEEGYLIKKNKKTNCKVIFCSSIDFLLFIKLIYI